MGDRLGIPCVLSIFFEPEYPNHRTEKIHFYQFEPPGGRQVPKKMILFFPLERNISMTNPML